ncbi:XRE family transcriptional regulator [Lactobacillus amylovorus]|jgi:transcriptional regulator with XRE-family HTH domain|nr:helix-turn-helix transcriptional regulator [Lactobacillus amylovorus]MCT3584917.1 XRE family transcriptional regulator [Lactobacillus amylovorus]MDB6223485.1 helix-turn-helix transcriptional regulator [Lactobacillus amylovorus]UIK35185.1 helix-turn-helix transcriptional regulator [Lactobacillus amylovorus]
MKISEALRKERQDRNLKQKDMIKNLAISKSHYSQIEHGKHRIYAEDLLKMLADNNIDYHHFFDEVAPSYGFRNDNSELQKEMSQAFYEADVKKAEMLKDKILQQNFPMEYKLHALLIVAELKKTKLDAKTQKEILQSMFSQNDWTKNRDTLRIFGNAMKYFDKSVRRTLMQSVLRTYKNINNFSDGEIIRIATICVNYLFNIDDKHDFQDKEVEQIFLLLKSLEPIPAFLMYKLLGKFYLAISKDQKRDAEEIKNVLRLTGYTEVAQRLEI